MSLLDGLILIGFLAATTALGAWLGRGDKSLGDFLLAGRRMPWWLILGSIVATETSTVTVLSVPGKAYDPLEGDFRFLQVAMGFALGRVLVAVFLLPGYFRGELYSAYEVLQTRFGVTTRRLASAVFLIARNVGDGLRLYLAALVLQQLGAASTEGATWSFPVCVLAVGVCTMIYTSLGGMRSVVWNDCIQLVIYLIGAVIAAAIILQRLPDGWETVLETARVEQKWRLFDFHLSNYEQFPRTGGQTLFVGLLGGAFLSFGTHGVDQMMVQRYLASRSYRDAIIALIGSGVFVIAQFALFLFLGVLLRAFYVHVAPEMQVSDLDKVFAEFIARELPLGAKGLVLAAIMAAAMSTLSSSFSSSAAALLSDFCGVGAGERHSGAPLLWGRIATYSFGVIQMLAALVVYYQGSDATVIDRVLQLAGVTTGLTLGVYLLGLGAPRAKEVDAVVGILFGVVVVGFMFYGLAPLQQWWGVERQAMIRIPHLLNSVFFSLSVMFAGAMSSAVRTRWKGGRA